MCLSFYSIGYVITHGGAAWGGSNFLIPNSIDNKEIKIAAKNNRSCSSSSTCRKIKKKRIDTLHQWVCRCGCLSSTYRAAAVGWWQEVEISGNALTLVCFRRNSFLGTSFSAERERPPRLVVAKELDCAICPCEEEQQQRVSAAGLIEGWNNNELDWLAKRVLRHLRLPQLPISNDPASFSQVITITHHLSDCRGHKSSRWICPYFFIPTY